MSASLPPSCGRRSGRAFGASVPLDRLAEATPDPSIWRARAPIAICGPTARMERSEPLAGASRRPSTVPDIDPQAGDRGYPSSGR